LNEIIVVKLFIETHKQISRRKTKTKTRKRKRKGGKRKRKWHLVCHEK